MPYLRFSSDEVERAAASLDQGAHSSVTISQPGGDPCWREYASRLTASITTLNNDDQKLDQDIDKTQKDLRETIRVYETTQGDIARAIAELQRSQGDS